MFNFFRATAVAALACLAMSPAKALDFNVTIKTIEGKDFTDAEGKAVPMMLKTLVVNSLLANDQQASLSGEEKVKRYILAQRIYASPKDPDLTVDDLKLIKDMIGKYQPTALAAPAILMLDPKAK